MADMTNIHQQQSCDNTSDHESFDSPSSTGMTVSPFVKVVMAISQNRLSDHSELFYNCSKHCQDTITTTSTSEK